MGYVTDGGLEPEPDTSIRAPQPGVNGVLALIYGDFGRFLGLGMPAEGGVYPSAGRQGGWGGERWLSAG